MTNRVTDSYTRTAGSDLVGTAGEVGATWVIGAGWAANATPVIDSTGGRIMVGTASVAVAFASGVATTDGEISTASVDMLSASGGFGVMTRANPNSGGSARGYMAYFVGGNVSILRLDNATTFTTVAAAVAHAFPIAVGDTVSIQATGTGASVALEVKHNGTVVHSGADASASRITAFGTVAVYLEAATQTTGAHITSVTHDDAAAAASMAITGPADGKIAPLSGGTTGTASLSLTGTYSGTAPNQWRLVDDGGSTAITGFDWQAFTVAPSAGAFAQTLAAVPKKNGWYNIQVRDNAVPGTVYTSGKAAPGAHVVVDGQSNAWLWFSSDARGGDSSLTASPLLRVTGKQAANAWISPTGTMNAAIACGNALVAAIGCPVALIDGSWDASGLTIAGGSGGSGPGGQWVPTSTNAYGSSLSAITSAGGKVLANVWIQGEGDAGVAVSQSAYYTALGTMIAQRRSDLSAATLPYVMVTLARDTVGMADASRESIKLAQVQKCADADVYRVDRLDLPLSDGVHHNATGFTALGKRVAQAILTSLGLVSQYRGPSIASVVEVSATVFDVTLTHHMGTDFTPTSAITGFRVTDPGAADAVIAVSSAVRQSAGVIRLTLASDPVAAPRVAYLWGSAPTITGVALDNSALTLPLEYSAGVIASGLTAVSSDLAASYAIGSSVSADLTGAYTVLAAVNADLGGAYALLNSVNADLAGSYAISAGGSTAVSSDFAGAYQIAASVDADLAAGFTVSAWVSADLAAGYSITDSTGTTSVYSDFAGAYSIQAYVSASLVGSYSIESIVVYARAPAGNGYTPQRDEGQGRPGQRNYR